MKNVRRKIPDSKYFMYRKWVNLLALISLNANCFLHNFFYRFHRHLAMLFHVSNFFFLIFLIFLIFFLSIFLLLIYWLLQCILLLDRYFFFTLLYTMITTGKNSELSHTTKKMKRMENMSEVLSNKRLTGNSQHQLKEKNAKRNAKEKCNGL